MSYLFTVLICVCLRLAVCTCTMCMQVWIPLTVGIDATGFIGVEVETVEELLFCLSCVFARCAHFGANVRWVLRIPLQLFFFSSIPLHLMISWEQHHVWRSCLSWGNWCVGLYAQTWIWCQDEALSLFLLDLFFTTAWLFELIAQSANSKQQAENFSTLFLKTTWKK